MSRLLQARFMITSERPIKMVGWSKHDQGHGWGCGCGCVASNGCLHNRHTNINTRGCPGYRFGCFVVALRSLSVDAASNHCSYINLATIRAATQRRASNSTSPLF
jgi:hypothetical protein